MAVAHHSIKRSKERLLFKVLAPSCFNYKKTSWLVLVQLLIPFYEGLYQVENFGKADQPEGRN